MSSLKLRALSSFPLYTKSHNAAEPKPTIHQESSTETFLFPPFAHSEHLTHTHTQMNQSIVGFLKAEHRFIYNQVLMGS